MMDTRDCACGQTKVRDEAARWFVRLQEPAVDVEEYRRFEAWLHEHPQHQDEFEMLQGLWMAADLVPVERLQAMCETAPVRRTPQPWVRYAVAASMVAVALGVGWSTGLHHAEPFTAEYSTALGERRHVVLPDGSLMDMNSRSRIQVRFDKDRRGIELTEGEAMFSVEHDTSRPFVVEAGNGQVTVTGTRFDVRRDPSQTRVAVEQGTVKVQGQGANVISLTAGLGTRIDAQGVVAAAYAVNPTELTAWRGGKLVFNNASLSEVAAEVSRYRERPLTVSNDTVGSLRLTSVSNSDSTDALIKALPSILPVVIRTLDDGSQEIISK